jgi:hypothetical protein
MESVVTIKRNTESVVTMEKKYRIGRYNQKKNGIGSEERKYFLKIEKYIF